MITDGLEYSYIEKHLNGSWDLGTDQNRCASEFLAPHTIHIISFDPSPATKTADFGCAIPHPIGGMLNSYPEAPVCIGSVFVGTTHMLNEDHSRQIVVNKLFVNPRDTDPRKIYLDHLRNIATPGSVLQVFVAAMPAGLKRRTGCQWALQLSVNSDEFRRFCEMSKLTSKQHPKKRK